VHGDIHDPLAFSDDRNSSSLSDVIAIELIGRFIAHLKTDFADELPATAITALQEIDQVRPVLLVPAWMENLLDRTVPQLPVRTAIKRTWDSLVEQMLAALCRPRAERGADCLIDGLSASLKFSRRQQRVWTGKTLAFLASLRGTKASPICRMLWPKPISAIAGPASSTVTHSQGRSRWMPAIPIATCCLTYFNAGTWRGGPICRRRPVAARVSALRHHKLLAAIKGSGRRWAWSKLGSTSALWRFKLRAPRKPCMGGNSCAHFRRQVGDSAG
jgi:hypothetical protein